MEDLYDNLNEYRMTLETQYTNEIDIIRELKLYLMEYNFNSIEVNIIIYNFYRYINVSISFNIIRDVIIDIVVSTFYYFAITRRAEENEHINKTLTDNEINNLQKNTIINNTQIDDCCPICLEKFDINDEYFNLKCGHIFHCNCISIYFKNYNTICPVCKVDLF